jgi:plasmid stabilization system protein ParE
VVIRLLETAQDDLLAGYLFYEDNAPGVGDYFLSSIDADVKSLRIYAGIHEIVDGFHRMLAKRFPYAIYYTVATEQIDIYAILDCRRDPAWIERRLSSARESR